MTTQQSDIAQALLDVRKAYRLLHDYQRSILDATNYIGTQLGFAYSGGHPLFSDCAPRVGRGALQDCAWKWLNLYAHEFHFIKSEADNQTLNFSIMLFSDTGYYDSRHLSPDENDITTFASVETSETKIGFFFYHQWCKDYNFFSDNEAISTFLKVGGQLPDYLMEAGARGIARDFDCLADQESTDSLLADLVHFGNVHGFSLSRSQLAGSTRANAFQS